MRTIRISKSSFMRFIIYSLIICIALENVRLFTIAGAAFKPMHVILILSIACNLFFGKLLVKDVLAGLFFLILPLLPLYRINDVTEWVKSYFSYALFVLFMATSMRTLLKVFQANYEKYVRFILFTIAITQILGVIQFICMNLFYYPFLYNFWGAFQFHHNQFGMDMGFYRAYSLFLEPSFFAWVSNTALCIVLFLNGEILRKRERIFFLLLSIVSVFCTLTVTGIAIALVLLFVYLLCRSKNPGTILISLVIALIALLLVMNFTDLLTPLERIFTEINTPGASGYERLVSPWLYVKKVLEHYPLLGRGLGQDGLVDAVGIIGIYAAVNNSVFGVFVWMGMSSFLFLIPALIYSIKNIVKDRCWTVIFVNLLGIYASTGAWCSVDTFIFLILLLAVGCKNSRIIKFAVECKEQDLSFTGNQADTKRDSSPPEIVQGID